MDESDKDNDMTCEECLLRQLAAFIDGEGTISIGKRLQKKGKYNYVQFVSLVNTDIRLIEWIIKNFAGKRSKSKEQGEGHKDVHRWNLFGSKSYKLLKKIQPYLLLKQEQADLAIELYEKVSKWKYSATKPMPEEKRELAEQLFQRCKELNKRGKDEDDDEIEVVIPVKIKKETLAKWI